jgi:hypothetical protein
MSAYERISDSAALGFALAPLSAALTLWLIFVLFQCLCLQDSARSLSELLHVLWDAMLWAMPLGYIAEAVVGLPLHLELRRRGNCSWLAYCLAGVATGIAPFALYGAFALVENLRSPLGPRGLLVGDLRFAVAWGAFAIPCGMVAGFTFWLVGIRADRGRAVEIVGDPSDGSRRSRIVFTSQEQAKRFFVDKIVDQAKIDGAALSDAEREMLSFSESDPEFGVHQALVEKLGTDISDEDYETKVAGLLERSWKRDVKADSKTADFCREAFRVLSQGDHYLLVMIKRALGPQLRPWWAFWR